MSFSRAPVKRFNDDLPAAANPAPADYDPKLLGPKGTGIAIQRSSRSVSLLFNSLWNETFRLTTFLYPQVLCSQGFNSRPGAVRRLGGGDGRQEGREHQLLQV